MKEREKTKILEVVNLLMTEFSIITSLLVAALLLNYGTHWIFSLLFFGSLLIASIKLIRLFSFTNELELMLQPEATAPETQPELVRSLERTPRTCEPELTPCESEVSSQPTKTAVEDFSYEQPESTPIIPDAHACLRKLPAGKSASNQAIALARTYGVDIPDGYTFVKPKL